jgi:hypothetical protein
MIERALKYRTIISDVFYQHKDNTLIFLLLNEHEWDSIAQLVEILRPLKKVTLLASEDGQSLCITKVLGMFQWCIDCLTKSLVNYNYDDDIYIGLDAAIEKLTHYYDDMSPMVGIALALDPSKKYKYLDKGLNWEKEWVESVKSNFAVSSTTKTKSTLTVPFKETSRSN